MGAFKVDERASKSEPGITLWELGGYDETAICETAETKIRLFDRARPPRVEEPRFDGPIYKGCLPCFARFSGRAPRAK